MNFTLSIICPLVCAEHKSQVFHVPALMRISAQTARVQSPLFRVYMLQGEVTIKPFTKQLKSLLCFIQEYNISLCFKWLLYFPCDPCIHWFSLTEIHWKYHSWKCHYHSNRDFVTVPSMFLLSSRIFGTKLASVKNMEQHSNNNYCFVSFLTWSPATACANSSESRFT